MIVFSLTNGPMTSVFDFIFRWILSPFFLLLSTVTVAKKDYLGKGNWLCVVGAILTFSTVTYTVLVEEMGVAFLLLFLELYLYGGRYHHFYLRHRIRNFREKEISSKKRKSILHINITKNETAADSLLFFWV